MFWERELRCIGLFHVQTINRLEERGPCQHSSWTRTKNAPAYHSSILRERITKRSNKAIASIAYVTKSSTIICLDYL
jgi:hypothetical protein